MNQKRKPGVLVPSSGKDYHFGRVGGGPVRPDLRERNRRRARSSVMNSLLRSRYRVREE